MTALATASNAPRRYIAVGAIALFAVVRTPRITYFPEQSAYRVLPQIAAHLLLTLTNYRYRAGRRAQCERDDLSDSRAQGHGN